MTQRTAKKQQPPQAPGVAERLEAARLVGAVLDRGRMLEEATDGRALSGPERAAARSLADLTLRRLGQVDGILARFAQRPPRAPVNHILRVMTAELVFGGAAPHAAVDSAVRAADGNPKTRGLKGLANAVGRRIASAGAEIAAGQDAAELNTPEWLAMRLVKDWGPETARAIAESHLLTAAHDLTLRGDEGVAPDGVTLPSGSLRLAGRPQVTALPGYDDGGWWLQDAAAALPARLISDPRGRTVLDLCAAPGGKTLQLAAAGAQVTALDISEHRLQRLHQNLRRTGLVADVVAADALEWTPPRRFDAILLDAPCSATGTVRRHPDLPWRFEPQSLPELTSLQDALLDRAWDWLEPGGILVFCTCSLLKVEGEERIAAFRDRHLDARLEPPAWLPPEFFAEGCLRTRPDMWSDLGHLDGFFAACLSRA